VRSFTAPDRLVVALAIFMVWLYLPTYARLIASPILLLAIIWIIPGAVGATYARTRSAFQAIIRNFPAYPKKSKSVGSTFGSIVRDDLSIFALIAAVAGGGPWFVSLFRSTWRPTVEPPIIYGIYIVVLFYLTWKLASTKKRSDAIPDSPQPSRQFVHTLWEQGCIGVGLFLMVALIVLYWQTHQTLADQILSWSQARKFQPANFEVHWHVLPREKTPDGKITYARLGFALDPRDWQSPMTVGVRLKNTTTAMQYKLGRMAAEDADKKPLPVGNTLPADTIRDVERRLSFEDDAARKPCTVVVRIAAKNNNMDLLADVERDPGIAIAPPEFRRWSQATNDNP
jgi:hypothetical protein